ncbi:Gfo/Idh/MocA family protein [Fredinandcohnia sp. 179-A 10B2 NHS]|uniref:Gfo/Idh/MocA family protein n=1 Tax=Fredinandcohnia sp. 179-A 10B2 NHS TaxID=3235176 RepID=UPI0039A02690
MKIGIIGLGDIAKKAYLPVYASVKDVEFHLYTRNQDTLTEVAETYRFQNVHQSIDSMVQSGIVAAFVHSSTESHPEIIRELLNNNIHVYVDKPISYNYETSKGLVALAEEKNRILMVGFNRRFAPVNSELKKAIPEPNMMIVQKNRNGLPNDVRTFVMDDFIHVIDTMRFLYPYQIEEITVKGRKKDNLLYHVVVQFQSENCTAIGIMNRDSGTREEKVEVMSSAEKRVIYNVAEAEIHKNSQVIKLASNDWEPTLHKRGFEQLVAEFIASVKGDREPSISSSDALQTHEICEFIIQKLGE